MNRKWVVQVAMLFAAAMPGCSGENDGHLCTAMGCGPVIEMKIDAPVDAAALQGCTVTVCRNDACQNESLSSLSGDAGNTLRLFSAGGPIDVIVWPASSGNPQIEMRWWDSTGAANGDRYRIEIKDSSGNVLSNVEDTVISYADSYPNGPECDRVPCRQAESVSRATPAVDGGR